MFLAIDVGNTNVHLGLAPSLDAPWSRTFRFSSARDRTADEWAVLMTGATFDTENRRPIVAMCSVVPAIARNLGAFVEQQFGVHPLIVSPRVDLGITIGTEAPFETGPDRITNAVAAVYRYGAPAIVVDFGTATKVDAISSDGTLLGGAIATGIGLSMDTLASRAARLYAVPTELPHTAIGRNTTAAVQAGVVLGHLKMVEGLIELVRGELDGCETVITTGGNGAIFQGASSALGSYDPELTLEGLRIIARRNT